MSRYTSIILFVSPGENLSKIKEEINRYEFQDGRLFEMFDLNDKPFPDIFPRYAFCGAYNNLDISHFLDYLQKKVSWEEPRHVRVLLQDDRTENVAFYSLNGLLDGEFI